jgi:hypothetical protein
MKMEKSHIEVDKHKDKDKDMDKEKNKLRKLKKKRKLLHQKNNQILSIQILLSMMIGLVPTYSEFLLSNV